MTSYKKIAGRNPFRSGNLARATVGTRGHGSELGETIKTLALEALQVVSRFTSAGNLKGQRPKRPGLGEFGESERIGVGIGARGPETWEALLAEKERDQGSLLPGISDLGKMNLSPEQQGSGPRPKRGKGLWENRVLEEGVKKRRERFSGY